MQIRSVASRIIFTVRSETNKSGKKAVEEKVEKEQEEFKDKEENCHYNRNYFFSHEY
jgi:hypothetical protein